MRLAGAAALGAAVERMQRGDGAGGRDLEDGAALRRCRRTGRAVEVAIAGLDEAGGGHAALGAAVEGMQRGEGAGGRDLEDGAAPEAVAAAPGRAVEVAIAGLDEAGDGDAALGAAVEGVQRGEGAGGRELEDGAAARTRRHASVVP